MRTNVFLSVVLMSCLWISCEKGGDEEPTILGNERPGSLPGIGNTPGRPTGSQFQLPAGVKLAKTIVGNDEGASVGSCLLDGAGFNVSVTMTLSRDSSVSGPVTVVFPPGLILISRDETKQNGVLLDSVLLTIPPVDQGGRGGTCIVNLLFSCLNEEKGISESTIQYELGPVSDSRSINGFIRELAHKKINYRMFEEGDSEWFLRQEKLQDLLWKITDGNGLKAEDLNWIRKLPSK